VVHRGFTLSLVVLLTNAAIASAEPKVAPTWESLGLPWAVYLRAVGEPNTEDISGHAVQVHTTEAIAGREFIESVVLVHPPFSPPRVSAYAYAHEDVALQADDSRAAYVTPPESNAFLVNDGLVGAHHWIPTEHFRPFFRAVERGNPLTIDVSEDVTQYTVQVRLDLVRNLGAPASFRAIDVDNATGRVVRSESFTAARHPGVVVEFGEYVTLEDGSVFPTLITRTMSQARHGIGARVDTFRITYAAVVNPITPRIALMPDEMRIADRDRGVELDRSLMETGPWPPPSRPTPWRRHLPPSLRYQPGLYAVIGATAGLILALVVWTIVRVRAHGAP
jgi:hypothetical protein